MADNEMINFGIGLLVLGVVGLTLPWNPLLDIFTPINVLVNENLEVIQATSALAIIGAIALFIIASKKKDS